MARLGPRSGTPAARARYRWCLLAMACENRRAEVTAIISHSTGRYTFWNVEQIVISHDLTIIHHSDRPDSKLQTESTMTLNIRGID